MSNKKETPVSWLRDKLFQDFGFAFSDNIANEALEMESKKQQKYDEMMAMLEICKQTTNSRQIHDEIEQLIKEAKEL
jgi:hypothetical protein